MSLSKRLEKLEYTIGNSDKERMFHVRRFPSGDWKIRKAIHRAKVVLGLLSPSEIRRKIFVGHDRHKNLHADMTKTEAMSILQQHGEARA